MQQTQTHNHDITTQDIRDAQTVKDNAEGKAKFSFIITLGDKKISGIAFYNDATRATLYVVCFVNINDAYREVVFLAPSGAKDIKERACREVAKIIVERSLGRYV